LASILKKVKEKKCRVCKQPFKPFNSIQPTCGKFECNLKFAVAHADKSDALRKKAERKELREKKQAIKNLSELHEDVKLYFNRFIRIRDKDDGCISCGTRKPTIVYAAGHYRTVGAAGHLRYNEDNVHKQCNHHCNKHLSGNTVNYRPALIMKIGLARVEALENNNAVHKWSRSELIELKKFYQLKVKELQNETENR